MKWFNDRELVGTIPPEAIEDCTRPGEDASEAVQDWVSRLGFQAPADYTREYLAGFGAWDEDELSDHAQNVTRLFWIICGDLKEDGPDACVYLEG